MLTPDGVRTQPIGCLTWGNKGTLRVLTANAVERKLRLLIVDIGLRGFAPAPNKGQRPLTLGYPT